MPRLKYKCPHCEDIIEYLLYTSRIREYGTAYLTNVNSIAESPEVDNHECDDSDTDSTDYECPICNRGLDADDLIVFKEEEKENEEDTKKDPPEKLDEEMHDIVITKRITKARANIHPLTCTECKGITVITGLFLIGSLVKCDCCGVSFKPTPLDIPQRRYC